MTESFTKYAYLHLREKIRAGKLLPGSRLSNRAVANELGVGVSPVRGALNQLISEGYLDHQPGLGVFVPVEDRREIAEIYEFREVLELAAVEKCCGRMSQKSLEKMTRCADDQAAILATFESEGEQALDRKECHRWDDADAEFHVAIVVAARNLRMAGTLEELCTRMYTVCHRLRDWPRGVLQHRIVNEHRAIVDGLRQGDLEQVQSVLSQHIRAGREFVLKVYDEHEMELRAGKLYH